MRRIAIIGAVTLVALVALALVRPDPGAGKVSTRIDLNAPTASANCSPCHGVLDETSNPDLRFSHDAHLLVECAACHLGVAHQDNETNSPPMESCFLCHGLAHGPQRVLASGECFYCHPAGFELKPQSHVKEWAKRPHAKAAEQDVNGCMLCHEAEKDCDGCHEAEKLEIAPQPGIYKRIIREEPPRPAYLIDVSQPTAMGQCVFCHPAIDRSGGWPGIIFTHEPHIKRDQKCEACHEAFPHTSSGTANPTMVSCYRCHSLRHAEQGPVAAEECKKCHPPTFPLKPDDHTRAFALKEHRDEADRRMPECMMCHKAAYCAKCHSGGQKMVDGKPSPQVLPDDHRTPEWQPTHGRLYLSQQGACSICHEERDCLSCHVTAMPHPTTWVGDHASATLLPDCGVCHADRTDCQNCHHQGLDQAELIRPNCTPCHDEMKNPKPTTIRNVLLAEHAVHFDVASSDSRDKPYVCPDCHIGFSATSVMEPAVSTQVHDLRVCYDCHGNLDLNNQLIAPYPGKELCYRCHPTLRL